MKREKKGAKTWDEGRLGKKDISKEKRLLQLLLSAWRHKHLKKKKTSFDLNLKDRVKKKIFWTFQIEKKSQKSKKKTKTLLNRMIKFSLFLFCFVFMFQCFNVLMIILFTYPEFLNQPFPFVTRIEFPKDSMEYVIKSYCLRLYANLLLILLSLLLLLLL